MSDATDPDVTKRKAECFAKPPKTRDLVDEATLQKLIDLRNRLAEVTTNRDEIKQALVEIHRFVVDQAGDDALFGKKPGSIEEGYVVQELRRLHRVVRTGHYEKPAHLE